MTKPAEIPPETEIVSIPNDEKGVVEIVPFGTDERIKLSVSIVQKMIAVPTKLGKVPDVNQCIKFMMLCRARHLNPFEGDAYMLGYDTQSGPQFSLITAHQVFLKRAEASKGFAGMESGVIVRQPDHDGKTGAGPILEREGDLVYDDEKLIGGWAKVHRKNLDKPMYRRVKLSTFNTGRSRWEKDPGGMICKCAEADALRSAFPTHLGGLYVQEESEPIRVEANEIPIARPKIERTKLEEFGHMALIPPKPSGSGSETNSGDEPKVRHSAPTPTGSSSDEPSAAPTKRTLKKRLPKPDAHPFDPSAPQVGPNESQMLMRLAGLERTKEQLVQVAKQFEALKDDQGWGDIGEDGFAGLLHPDNWKLVEPELKIMAEE